MQWAPHTPSHTLLQSGLPPKLLHSNLASFSYDKPVVMRVTQNSSSSLIFHGENLGDHSLSAYGGTMPQIIVHYNGTTWPDCASDASAHDHVRVTTDLCQAIGDMQGANLTLIITGQNVTFYGPMIDSIEIVEGTTSEISNNMPRTAGGAALKISGMYFTDPNISVTVGGNDCPVTKFDRDEPNTVWCTVPAGQGANQMVQVTAGVMRSMPVGLSYLRVPFCAVRCVYPTDLGIEHIYLGHHGSIPVRYKTICMNK